MPKLFNQPTQKPLRQKLRNSLTSAEIILWSHLQGRKFYNLKFRRQQGIGPYVVDFYCPEIHLAIEVDGASHFTPDQKKKDLKRTQFLESKGIRVVRVMNGDVYADMEKVLRRIEAGIPENNL